MTDFQRGIYLATVGLAVASFGFLIAPVSLHRILFRRHARQLMVLVTHRLAVVGVALLSVAITGVVLLIFDAVAGRPVAVTAAVTAVILLASLWAALPWYARAVNDREPDTEVHEIEPVHSLV